MKLDRIDQYSLSEDELKEAISMLVSKKYNMEIKPTEITLYCDVDDNQEPFNFTATIQINSHDTVNAV